MHMRNVEDVPSPCRNICRLDDEDVCEGCHRTIDEITRWPQMSDEEKRSILARIEHSIE
ncbi:MAG: DUF1289 domain-containing protein [Fimbriimonadaceae bacterium]|nr:DUF1289 domain-containing protein [Fimbriimonadaceae bacterium]